MRWTSTVRSAAPVPTPNAGNPYAKCQPSGMRTVVLPLHPVAAGTFA